MAAASLTEPRCASERSLAMGGGRPRSAASRWEAAANPRLGAIARCSRTRSSNSSPSSGESTNFRFLSRRRPFNTSGGARADGTAVPREWWRPRRTYRRSRLGECSVDIQPRSSWFAKNRRSSASFPVSWNRVPRAGGLVRTPKSGRYLPKNVSGDGWTPAWIAFAELRMPFVVSSVLKRSIATSSIITSAAAMPPADHALRIVRAAA